MVGKRITLCLGAAVLLFTTASVCFADAAADLSKAESYVQNGMFTQAEPLCLSIVQNNPGSDYALKAQGKLAVIYIMTQRLSLADTEVNQVIAAYRSNAELPGILYGIVNRFKAVKDNQRAQNLSQRIVQGFPNSQQAQKIQLDSGKDAALAFIAVRKFSQAQNAVNSMVATCENNPQLAAALFKIAREFKEGCAYDDAQRTYQQIVDRYPSSEFAGKARMAADKLRIWALINAGDVNNAQINLAKLIRDYNDADDLGHTVHGVALKFEEAGFYDQAKTLYQKVKTDYSGTDIAARATLDLQKCDIRAMVGKSSPNDVTQQINNLLTTFSGDSHLPLAIWQIGQACYMQAARLDRQGSAEQARVLYANAASIWDIAINQLPSSATVPQACHDAGICYGKLGQYDKADACFQKAIDNYPGYGMRWNVMLLSGKNYQKMKNAGTLSASQADEKTRTIYQRLVSEYPDCEAADYARNWLNQ